MDDFLSQLCIPHYSDFHKNLVVDSFIDLNERTKVQLVLISITFKSMYVVKYNWE